MSTSDGNVTYLCCPVCRVWYREGSEHLCGPHNFDIQYGDRAIPDGKLFARQTFTPPIVSSAENPTVISTEIRGHFSDDERLYALLERIAVALERLADK